MEFNPDGSLKVPESHKKPVKKINIRKDVISEYAPKKCMITVRGNDPFVSKAIAVFSCESPIKKTAVEGGFDIEIGSDFKRCSDCCSLVFRISSSVNGNCYVDKGTCTSKMQQQNFCEEDYFS